MKYKVAMVAACPFPANHGSAASIREMSEALVRLGHEIHVVTYPVSQDIPVSGVNIHRVNVPFLRPGGVRIGPSLVKVVYDLFLVFELVRVIRHHKIDIIHAHNYEAAIAGWIGKLLTRTPLIYNGVTTMKEELPTYNFLRPRQLAQFLGQALDYCVPRAAGRVTVVSDELGEYLAATGIPRQRITVVPAGVNLNMFEQADRAAIRERHGLQGVPLVMYTGALEEFQRIDYLLRALQWVVAGNPSVHLLLVGNVPNPAQLAKYRDLARSLGIEANVTFLDSVPLAELPDYLAAADVAVVPRTECPGHPVKLLNYMAAGRPIVSFRGGAKGLHHMHNGFLADNHDCVALGKGIQFLLQNPDLAENLGRRARETILGIFDWDTLARGIERIYGELLTAGSGFAADAHNPHLKASYTPVYVERRADKAARKDSARDRRLRADPIDFLERRKVEFPPFRPQPESGTESRD